MDGFRAIRKLLSYVHPTLTRKAPPATPPLYSHTEDIHLYEQDLRNYYLRHYLHTKIVTSDYDQAKQYIKGLDTTMYKEGCRRIRNKLDSYDPSQELDPDLSLIHITSTVINFCDNLEENDILINTMDPEIMDEDDEMIDMPQINSFDARGRTRMHGDQSRHNTWRYRNDTRNRTNTRNTWRNRNDTRPRHDTNNK